MENCTLIIVAVCFVFAFKCTDLVKIAWSRHYFLRESLPFTQILPAEKRVPLHIFKTGPLPPTHPFVQPLLSSFRRDNPEIAIRYFNDSESRLHVKKHCGSRAFSAYDTLLSGSLRADLFRYCALWSSGGIYSDLSHMFRVPVRELVDFERDELVLVRDRPRHRQYPGVTPIQISFMAAAPRHPLLRVVLLRAIENVHKRFYGKSSLEVTGPFLFGKTLYEHPGYQFRLQLEEVGGRLTYIKSGKTAIVTKLGGSHEAVLRLNKTARYNDLWAGRKLYRTKLHGTSRHRARGGQKGVVVTV